MVYDHFSAQHGWTTSSGHQNPWSDLNGMKAVGYEALHVASWPRLEELMQSIMVNGHHLIGVFIDFKKKTRLSGLFKI